MEKPCQWFSQASLSFAPGSGQPHRALPPYNSCYHDGQNCCFRKIRHFNACVIRYDELLGGFSIRYDGLLGGFDTNGDISLDLAHQH